MSVESALARLEKKAAREVARHALGLQAEWREVLSQKGSGRVYGGHQASAPGEAPAVDTGALRNAVQVAQMDPLTYVVGIAGKVKHPTSGTELGIIAITLERGGRKLAPRPHARVALDNYKAKARR